MTEPTSPRPKRWAYSTPAFHGHSTRLVYDANDYQSEPFLANPEDYLSDPNDLLSNVKADETIVTPQADLRLTHTIYDRLGRVVETRRLAGAEITMTTVTPQGSSAEFPVTEFDPPSTPDILTASITSYIHDGLGRVTETRAELPNATPGFDYVSTMTHYDSLGRRDAQIDPLGERTEYGHDDVGRLTSVTLPKVLNAVNGERQDPIYSYQYDVYGNQTATTDPKLNITEYTFDHFNRQISRTLPIGFASPSTTDFVERMWYDDAIATAVGSVGHGQLAYSKDFENNIIKYVYDNTSTGGGRLVSKEYYLPVQDFNVSVTTTLAAVRTALIGKSPVRTIEFLYDAFGRNVKTIDDKHGTTTNTFDADGRIVLIVSPEGFLHHEYDRAGRMTRTWTTAESPTGTTINDTHYFFDVVGRIVGVDAVKRNGATAAEGPTKYYFDANGNLDQTKTPNGVFADYAYDELNRLVLLRHFKDEVGGAAGVFDVGIDQLFAEFEYTVRADGKRTKVVEAIYDGATFINQTFEWDYDELGRLKEERYNGTSDDYIARYTFDLASNRHTLSKDLGNADPLLFEIDEITTYDVDENDRLRQEETHDGASNLLRSVDYEYGGVGNPATYQTKKTERDAQGIPTQFTISTFDVRGSLSRIEVDTNADGSPDQDFEYKYNEAGIRVSSKNMLASLTTLYHVAAQNPTGYAQVLEEGMDNNGDGRLQASEIDRSYTIGHDLIGQTAPEGMQLPSGVTAGEPLFFLYDGHGSTRTLVKLNAAVIADQQFSYDAYGNNIGFVTTDAITSYLYSGEQTDQTGLQYLRSRYLDPKTGRMISTDVYAGNTSDPISLHKYLYAHADPVNMIDPSGLLGVFSQAFGYAVEDEVEDIYARDFRGNDVTYGKWARLPGAFRAKPDILDRDRRIYLEIKPLSPSGIASAIAQMGLRALQLGPLGYLPDATWKSAPQLIRPLGVDTVFFNVAGVLFYTDVVDAFEDYVAITALESAWALLTNPTLLRSYAFGISHALGLANTGRAADSARFESQFSISAMLGSLGFV